MAEIVEADAILHAEMALDGVEEPGKESNGTKPSTVETEKPWYIMTKFQYFAVFIMFFTNLLNYMDRYSISALVTDIEGYFSLDKKSVALIQSVFIVSFMVVSPPIGYLGDRYKRVRLMFVGMVFWTAVGLGSSFVPRDAYWLFLVLRGLVGVGEASYTVVSPSIIGDIFNGFTRVMVITIFQVAVPLGSGLGYVMAGSVSKATGQWQWAFRVTPILTATAACLLFLFLKEPQRGSADGAKKLETSTSWIGDLKYIATVKSFWLICAGFVCIQFATGAFAFWTVDMLRIRDKARYETFNTTSNTTIPGVESEQAGNISLMFGAVVCSAGIVGVLLGTMGAKLLRPYTPAADAYVCAIGMVLGAPISFLAVYSSQVSVAFMLPVAFFAMVCLFENMVLVIEMCISVIKPTQRGTAEAILILTGHLFGDATSPFICGALADMQKKDIVQQSSMSDFRAIQNAMYILPFIIALGALFFFICAIYLPDDLAECKRRIKEDEKAALDGHAANENGNGEDVAMLAVTT